MSEIFNLHTLCRCCHSDGSFKSLQLPYWHDNRIEVYAAMLKETLDITINPPPLDASYAICEHCIRKLRDATCFKHQVLECEQKFEEYCKNEQALTAKAEIDYDTISEYDRSDENTKFDGGNDAEQQKTNPETAAIGHDRTHKTKRVLQKIFPKTVRVRNRRRKKNSYQVDPDFETCVESEGRDMYVCKICEETFKLLRQLRGHIKEQHKGAYKCQICSLQCMNRLSYRRHSKTHSSEVLKCQFCGKHFRTKYYFSQHVNLHTEGKKFQCDLCQKFFVHKFTLKKHLRLHYSATKPCICDICGKACNDNSAVRAHIQSVHEKQRPFKCLLCPKDYTTKKHLKIHTFHHTGEKPFKCDVCFQQFVSPWTLKHHQYKCNLDHGIKTVKKIRLYTCKICRTKHESRAKLLCHLKTHIGQKPFQCHICRKEFTCKYSLNRHVNGHSGVRAFGCDMCSKKYVQRGQLNRHKKQFHDPNSETYSNQVLEMYKCDICNRSYRNMKMHLKSHNIRPHVCDICLKPYPDKSTLNRHILYVHEKLKPHPCTLCDKKYAKWIGLQRHMKLIHKLELYREVRARLL